MALESLRRHSLHLEEIHSKITRDFSEGKIHGLAGWKIPMKNGSFNSWENHLFLWAMASIAMFVK